MGDLGRCGISMPTIKRVAIVGAGPTGVACAKYLLAEKSFDSVDVFEQRDRVGGIWNLSGTERSRHIPVPQTNPRYGSSYTTNREEKASDDLVSTNNDSLEFESPLYNYLETNIPKTLMAYSDMPFSAQLPLFPGHAQVLQYLEDYAKPVKESIRFSTQVIGIQLTRSSSRLAESWSVTTMDLKSRQRTKSEYDAVVIANGHYTVPSIPPVTGVARWNKTYPNTIIHSKAYRQPQDYAGLKVLVIGNSASGLDIAAQLAPHVQQPVVLASRSASQLAPSGKGPNWRHDVSEIEEFLDSTSGDRAVRTKSGEIIEKLDAVIFATGYFYSFPFLSNVEPTTIHNNHDISDDSSRSHSPTSDSDTSDQPSTDLTLDEPLNLVTTGLSVRNVYKHFLHVDHPTLALPVLNLKIIPFPLGENQAAVIARLWSGRLDMPSRTEMLEWCESEEQRLIKEGRLKKGGNVDGGGYHVLRFPEDAAQINSLYTWAASARTRSGLEHEGTGKLGTRWDEEQVWLRSQFPDIKAAFAGLGDQRVKVTSLADLPEKFSYQRWRAETHTENQKDLMDRAGVSC